MLGIKYNPNPARVWSRVQNRCSTDTADSTVDYAKIDYDRQMLLKGNILQYKKNSSNLTKNQRYTQIAKGMWTNRTKTWATQSDTYTNPNNSSLLRVNYTILDPSNNTFSSRSNPFNCPTTEIQDGGNLVCNVVVNPCTQEVIKRSVSQQLCNPTTDSDVPGQIQQLCWNDGTQTWYPRQRYTMGNSGTSWPEGYKGFVSALTLEPPVLTLDSRNCNSVTLSWTAISNDCMPISSFNIYQNGVLIDNVLYPIHTITINNLSNGNNYFYVTSVSSTIESDKSNIVTDTFTIPDAPTITTIDPCYKQATISWTEPLGQNPAISYYTIYQTGYSSAIYPVVTLIPHTVTGLINGQNYNFTVSATNTCGVESAQSTIYNLTMPITSTYFTLNQSSSQENTSTDYIVYFATPPSSGTTAKVTYNTTCTPVPSVIFNVLLVGAGGGGAAGTTGYNGGGGGGGGEIRNNTYTFTQNNNYYGVTVIGTGGAGGNSSGTNGSNGGSVTFDYNVGAGQTTGTVPGGAGGSGGGNGGAGGSGGGNGGAGGLVFNENGTSGSSGSSGYSGGGGGGAYTGFGGAGGAGNFGIGGIGGSNNSVGGDANPISYGSGGGGGGAGISYFTVGFKGAGAMVRVTIPN